MSKDFKSISENLNWIEEELDNFLSRENFDLMDYKDNFLKFFKERLRNAVRLGSEPRSFIIRNFSITLMQFNNENQRINVNCIEDKFVLNDFVNERDAPMISAIKIARLKELFTNILLPITYYYKRRNPELKDLCMLVINKGLTSLTRLQTELQGTIYSELLTGNGVNFSLAEIDTTSIVQDIVNDRIPIKFGILYEAEASVHITNPLLFNNKPLENLYLRTLSDDNKTLVHKFLK